MSEDTVQAAEEPAAADAAVDNAAVADETAQPAGGPRQVPMNDAAVAGEPDGADKAPAAAAAPEIPEQFRGKDDAETIGKLLTAYQGARQAIGDIGTVPKQAADYQFGWNDDTKAVLGDMSEADEKVEAALKQAAHEAGVPAKLFAKFMPAVVTTLAKEGIISAPDTREELLKLGQDVARGSPEDLRTAGAARLMTMKTWLDTLNRQDGLGKAEHGALYSLLEEASGVRALEALRNLMSGPSVRTGADDSGGAASASRITRADIDKARADPRYNSLSSSFDARFRAEAEAREREFFGSGRARNQRSDATPGRGA